MTGGNVAAEFLAAASDRLDAPFLIDAGRTWTYGEFFDRVRSHAAVLADAGAQPGDRVLVQVEKSPEAVALYVACLWAGTAHVPLNPAFAKALIQLLAHGLNVTFHDAGRYVSPDVDGQVLDHR